MRRAVGNEGNEFDEPTGEVHLATIALRRVSSAELQGKARENPMNRLVPYLDLFGRLSDEELARLASVPTSAASNLRRQVIQVDRALERFADLLPRLSDAEMVRLTGATAKTVRFWRLCQPRVPVAHDKDDGWSVSRAAEKLGQGGAPPDAEPVDAPDEPLDSGTPLPRRRATSETRSGSGEHRRHGSGEQHRHDSAELASPYTTMAEPAPARRRHPSGETPGVSAPAAPSPAEITWTGYRMPAEERDAGPQRRAPVDLSSPRPASAPSPAADFSQSVAAVASARKGGTHSTPPPPEVVEKHRVVSQQMQLSGAPFPGYDAEASGTHDDGIFIGLEIPEPLPGQPGHHDQD